MYQDHPRLCGEKVCAVKLVNVLTGSPPPMRGKDRGSWVIVLQSRITPAYAGKRNNSCSSGCLMKDHPRLCGEKFCGCLSCGLQPGSPPPMRGKAACSTPHLAGAGITPAYAGKSRGFDRLVCVTEDHPRLCGEKYLIAVTDKYNEGSPPPMRGKVFRIRQRFFVHRITPAYAGKSSVFGYEYTWHQDHPRLCGEKLIV